MQDLKGTTVEHMIAQSVNNQESYSKYYEHSSNFDAINMILTQKFWNNPKEYHHFHMQ